MTVSSPCSYFFSSPNFFKPFIKTETVMTERLLCSRVVKHTVWECVSHCVGLGDLHRIPTAPVTKLCVKMYCYIWS